MKTFKILAFILIFASCQKEDDKCRTCTIRVESNEKEARYHCQGLANSFPGGYVLISETNSVFCETPKNTQTFRDMCYGVRATIRTTYNCR
jgi:hypothetical protein